MRVRKAPSEGKEKRKKGKQENEKEKRKTNNKRRVFVRVDQVEEDRSSLESEGRYAHYREHAPQHLQSDGASDFLGSGVDKRSVLHIIVRD